MNEGIRELLRYSGLLIPILALMIPIVAIIFGSIAKILMTGARERTRREIAAYVAEGSIGPDEAERILNAGRSSKKDSC